MIDSEREWRIRVTEMKIYKSLKLSLSRLRQSESSKILSNMGFKL